MHSAFLLAGVAGRPILSNVKSDKQFAFPYFRCCSRHAFVGGHAGCTLGAALDIAACRSDGGDVNAGTPRRTYAARTLSLSAPLLAGGALLASTAATPSKAQQAPDSGPPLIAQACVGCHGQAGAGSGSVPKIAGYSRDLFIAQWAAFRNKERPATMMDRIAKGYTEADVAVLADYFSKLKK
jgi:sulfide dehydrogenase cytochrome subunit